MLMVTLENVGKKFGREWVFRGVDLSLQEGSRIAILGGNGSGKSTLLQVIAGYVTPNEGRVYFESAGNNVPAEDHHKLISFASPYLQLPEDLTGLEVVAHTAKFKPFLNNLAAPDVLHTAGLSHAANKLVRQYSSGMKQRLKLALAILADTRLLLLDEPVSNLDSDAKAWYSKMIDVFGASRAIVVCSNADKDEYYFCEQEVLVASFK